MKIEIEKLNWEKVDQLIPAVIQDAETRQVLMLGYMNKDALQQTYALNKITFYSRTKKRLWTKGEVSGNELILVEILPDCDNDALLVLVKPTGSCCHRSTTSCFGTEDAPGVGILARLEKLLQQRYQERPENSYTTKLFTEGVKRIAQKVGEEGVEVALAAVVNNKEEIKNETADLIFHLFVLLRASDIDLSVIWKELQCRMEFYSPNV